MPAVARNGDTCGGVIIAPDRGATAEGQPIACLGDRVTPHGKNEHAHAVLISASDNYIIKGLGVCRIGDRASCGHVISSGAARHTND
jgi:uncharacterized Zn-binding protein involved in type VI secretion